MPDLFQSLQDEDFFVQFVIKHATTCVPHELNAFYEITNKVSEEHVHLAHAKYVYEIARFSTYLNSKDPDHFKRSGALLMALCQNPVISGLDGAPSEEELAEIEGGFTRYNYSDAQYIYKYLNFHHTFHNQFAAFDIAFRACSAYMPAVKEINFDVVHNICHYLKQNNLVADSYYMVFRLLMA